MPVPVTLTITNGSDIQQAGEVIQSMASEAGFDVKIKTMEFASSLQAAYAGDFQAYLIGWSGRADPDGNMWQMLHTGGTFNYGHYSNADVDKALDDARTVAAVDQRRAFYAKVWEQERKDLPLIYLWTGKNIVGMKKASDGLPAGAGRADPAARDGDEVTGVRALRPRQPHHEPRAHHLVADPAPVLGGDPPPQRLDDLPADRQPQPRVLAEFLPRRPLRIEPVEDMLQIRPPECPALRPRR